MDAWVLLGGASVSCVISGVVPLVSAEVVVLVAAAVLPAPLLGPLVVGCAAGQMLAKGGIYICARWSPKLLPARIEGRLERVLERAGRGTWGQGTLVFASATLGLPPLYLVTVASGIARIDPALFLGAGLAGRILRFGALALGAATGSDLLGGYALAWNP